MNPPNRPVQAFILATAAAGLALWVPTSLAVAHAGIPTLLFPLPLLTMVPALLLASSHLYAVLTLVPLAYLLWQPGLYVGARRVPLRSFVLLGVAILINAIWCIGSWKFGIEYQDLQYTRAVCLIDATCAVVLSIAFCFARKRDSFLLNLLLQWCLFAWLAWYAFPWMGELL